jgi:hypothetical protein
MDTITLTDSKFDPISRWEEPVDNPLELLNPSYLDMLDQNGYHLTKTEQLYAEVNGYPLVDRRHETVIRQDWMIDNQLFEFCDFNHCDLFERKGYAGLAKDQLKRYTPQNKRLWKLIKMYPKYGIDVSIDYTDYDGNVFEVFHFEWDSFEYQPIQDMKHKIEEFVLKTDWDDAGKELLKRKDEWFDLEFFEQTKWRTDFFGLPEEKFKQVIWEK